MDNRVVRDKEATNPMRVHEMSRLKSVILALVACAGALCSASPAVAAPCIASAATNFCHAEFDVNNFTSSTFRSAAQGFNTVTGANATAPNSGSATGMTYSIDSSGFGAISMTSLKNVTNTITWTFTTGGYFSFDWLISGQSSNGAKSYVIKNGGTPILLGTGVSALSNVFGHYGYNVTAGQTFSLRHVGTTNNLNNSSQLQVSSFKGVPEINGGVLPLGMLLLGLLFIAAKRKDAGDVGETGAAA